MSIVHEFREFVNEYKIVGVAIAFIIGLAVTDLSQSLVNDIIMPIITVFIPESQWEAATITIGSATLRWGLFLSSLINFIIIAIVVFLIVKIVVNEKKK